MTVSSKRLLIRTDCPIDPLTLQIIRLIDGILHGAGIPYMLVGATARDLLLHHVYGLPVTRATYDVDFAILVDSWEQFATVKQLFLKVPGFIDKGRDKQRLFYQQAPAAPETTIDIIPFGKLEAGDRTIAWPPDAEVVMNVAAFSDVFKGALVVELEPTLQIPIPSLAGLVILKLFAWLDRRDGRDVQDLRRLLETYTEAGNEDRLYEEGDSRIGTCRFRYCARGSVPSRQRCAPNNRSGHKGSVERRSIRQKHHGPRRPNSAFDELF